jgi:ribosome-binding protein aMBF1 (putative translation factor)
MRTKAEGGPSISWRRVRERSTTPAFRAAYAERRLELEVAAMIHTLRRKRGISQRELARLAGTRQSAIARLEGAGENITISRLQKIALLLGADVRIELTTGRA